MAINTKTQLVKYIWQDYYRNYGTVSKSRIQKEVFKNSTVNLLIQFRICNYCCNVERKSLMTRVLHVIAYWRFQTLQQKCGIEMNQHTEIGAGLRLPHKYGIIIHPLSVIGNNCEIMNGVTLGNNIMKDRNAVPRLGDDVLVGTGAKVIGNVTVGNNVVIGANSVVNKSVDNNTIVAGIPAKVIKTNTSNAHVINKQF